MTTGAQSRTAGPSRTGLRRRAVVAGALYLLTFATSIPTLVLYGPLRDHTDFVLGAGATASVRTGMLLELALAAACVGTAVALFPVLRPRSASAALGLLASRVVEAALILVGVVSLLAVLVLRHDVAGSPGADPASLVTAGHALLAVYDGTFLLGQSLMPVVSAVCLGSALYRFRLVPRAIPALGLVGAPLLLASDVAVVLGAYPQGTAPAALAALPIATWELALGVWLIAKGFSAPASEGPLDPDTSTDQPSAAQGSPGPTTTGPAQSSGQPPRRGSGAVSLALNTSRVSVDEVASTQ